MILDHPIVGATSRALDHVVLPCRDLAASAAAWADLGFIVGRRNRHPWGTENHIIQFDGVFLELVAMAADATPPAPGDDAFPFAGFLAGLGASRAPSGMVVLRSGDARGDAAAYARDRIGEGRMLFFSRSAATPDGETRTVSFTVGFASAPAMPDLGFFVCQQHQPENFWNPAFQRHPNGATGVAALRIETDAPEASAAFLARFTESAADPVQGGLAFALDNSRLDVVAGHGSARLVALEVAAPGPPRQVVLDGGLVLSIG